MGVCASSHINRQRGGMDLPSKAMVVDMDGRLQEYMQPIKAAQILSFYPNCLLCSSETMHVDSVAAQVAPGDELQLGQLYFLMPISKSQTPFSLQDLCGLAIKASTALNNADAWRPKSETSTFLHENKRVIKFLGRSQDCCRMPNGYNIIGMNNSQSAFRQSAS